GVRTGARRGPRGASVAIARGAPRGTGPAMRPRRRGGSPMATPLSSEQQALSDLWDAHVRAEFVTHEPDVALAQMVGDATVDHVPVLTGGSGKGELKEFYGRHFIPEMPADTEMVPVSRTIGADRLVEEIVFRFTHTLEMEWMLSGVAPTGKRVEVPLVAVAEFRDGKLARERIYWDQ